MRSLEQFSKKDHGFLDGAVSWLLGIGESLIYLTSLIFFFFFVHSFSCSVSLPSLGAICLFELRGELDSWFQKLSFFPKFFFLVQMWMKIRVSEIPHKMKLLFSAQSCSSSQFGTDWASLAGARDALCSGHTCWHLPGCPGSGSLGSSGPLCLCNSQTWETQGAKHPAKLATEDTGQELKPAWQVQLHWEHALVLAMPSWNTATSMAHFNLSEWAASGAINALSRSALISHWWQ